MAGVVITGGLALAPSAAQAATTLNVDNAVGANCSDTPTAGQPYCTIGAANSVAVAGDTISVSPGIYTERVNVVTSGVTMVAPQGATIDGGGTTPQLYGIKVAAPGVVVDGFTFNNQGSAGVFVDGTGPSGADSVTVRNVTVTGSAINGIRITSGTNDTVSDVKVSGSGSIGVLLQGCTGSTVSSSQTFNNQKEGVSIQGGSNDTVEGVSSYSNDSANDGATTRLAPGINVTDWVPSAGAAAVAASNILVQDNVSYGNDDSGIQVYGGSQDVTVRRNLVYDNGDHGIDISQASTANVVSNTVVHNYTAGINIESNNATPAVGSNGTVRDNVSINNGYGDRTHGDIRVDTASTTTGSSIDHDLVFDSGGQTVLTWGTTTYPSLDAFHKDVPTQEVHGLQGDPKLDANDVPMAGSRAIDAADTTATGWTDTDLVGNGPVDDPVVKDTGVGTPTYADLGALERINVDKAPVAQLTVSPTTVNAGGMVTLDATGSSDPDGRITGYAFDCGAPGVNPAGTGAKATCTYPNAGSYNATVTVTDDAGASTVASKAVTVNAMTPPPGGGGGGGSVNAAPTAQLTANPATVAEGRTVTLDASASTDADGTITGYAFDCGATGVTANQNGDKATCSYPTAGSYTAAVTVTDNQGGTGKATTAVTVKVADPAAPTAALKGGRALRGQPIRIDASGSLAGSGATIDSYLFRCAGHWVGPKAGSHAICVFRHRGVHRVLVKVTDSNGMSDWATAQVRVVRGPRPVARLRVSDHRITVGGSVLAFAGRSHGAPYAYIKDVRFACGNGQHSRWRQSRTYRCSFDQPGRYTVTVVVRNTQGRRDAATRVVRVRRR